MRGPGNKTDSHIRRTWRCPACGYERHVSGALTTVRCRCSDSPFMKLTAEPRFQRPEQKPVDVYVDADEILGPSEQAEAPSEFAESIVTDPAPPSLPPSEVVRSEAADFGDLPAESGPQDTTRVDPSATPQSPPPTAQRESHREGRDLPQSLDSAEEKTASPDSPQASSPPRSREQGRGRRRRGGRSRGPRPPKS